MVVRSPGFSVHAVAEKCAVNPHASKSLSAHASSSRGNGIINQSRKCPLCMFTVSHPKIRPDTRSPTKWHGWRPSGHTPDSLARVRGGGLASVRETPSSPHPCPLCKVGVRGQTRGAGCDTQKNIGVVRWGNCEFHGVSPRCSMVAACARAALAVTPATSDLREAHSQAFKQCLFSGPARTGPTR